MNTFYTLMTLTALILAAGSGIAVAHQLRLNDRIHQCERASGVRCSVEVAPVESSNG